MAGNPTPSTASNPQYPTIQTGSGPATYKDGNWYCNCGGAPQRRMRFARKREEPKRPFYRCPDYGTAESCQVFMFADDPTVERTEAFAADSSGLLQTRISHYWPQVKKTTDARANWKGKAVDKDPFMDADEGQDEHISSCSPCPKPVNRAQLSNTFMPASNKFVTSCQALQSSTLPVRPRHPGDSRTPADADPEIQLHSETSRLAQRHSSAMITPPTRSVIPALSSEASSQSDDFDDDIWNDEGFKSDVVATVEEAETRCGNLKGPQLASNEPPQTPSRSAIQPRKPPQTPENILPPPSSTPGTISRGGFVMATEQEGLAVKRQKHHHEDTSFKGTQANFIAPTLPRTLPDAPSSPADSEHFPDAAEVHFDNEDDRMDIQEDYVEEEQSDKSGEGKEEQEEEDDDEHAYYEVGHEHVQHEDQSTCEAPSTPSRRASNAPTTISNGLVTPIKSRNRDGRYKNVRTGRVPFSGARRNPPHSSSPSLEPPPPLEDAIMDDVKEIMGAAGEPVSPDTLRKLRRRVAERAAPVTKELAMEKALNRRLRTVREDTKFRHMELLSRM